MRIDRAKAAIREAFPDVPTGTGARRAAYDVIEKVSGYRIAEVWPGDNEVTIDLTDGTVIHIGVGDPPS